MMMMMMMMMIMMKLLGNLRCCEAYVRQVAKCEVRSQVCAQLTG